MALVDIINGAAIEMRIAAPINIDGSTDPTVIDLVYFANRALKECLVWHEWTALSTAGELLGDGVTTAFPPPTGFDRMCGRQKMQKYGSGAFRLFGPLNADQKVDWRSLAVVAFSSVFWFRGGNIVITPALPIGQKGIYEFQTKVAVVEAVNLTKKILFTKSADTCLIDEDLVRLGLIWLWKAAKGFDYAQDFETWKARINILAARDQSMENVAVGTLSNELPIPNIPEQITVS
jgi:hypothetical protein